MDVPFCGFAGLGSFFVMSLWSEEMGRSHTLAGDKASFAGVLPSETGATFRFKMMFYDGNVEKETS